MSNFINPSFCGDFVDDQIGTSVQGCYTGTLDIPQERMLDKKMKSEARIRAERTARLNQLGIELEYAIGKIVSKKKMGATDDELAMLRKRAMEIREEMDEIKGMI